VIGGTGETKESQVCVLGAEAQSPSGHNHAPVAEVVWIAEAMHRVMKGWEPLSVGVPFAEGAGTRGGGVGSAAAEADQPKRQQD
jgi:hypothetical protein